MIRAIYHVVIKTPAPCVELPPPEWEVLKVTASYTAPSEVHAVQVNATTGGAWCSTCRGAACIGVTLVEHELGL